MADANGYFNSRFVFDPRRQAIWKEICRFLQKRYISKDATILEIGAGYCEFINNICGSKRHALDVSNEILRYVGQGVRGHVQSCTALDLFEEGSFDVVFASNVFEHLTREEMVRTLSEVRRVLRDGGKLIIIQPNFKYACKEYFDDYTHVQVFTHVGLCDLLMASGFSILALKPRFIPFSMKSKLPKIPLLVKLYLGLPFKPFAGQMLIVTQNRK